MKIYHQDWERARRLTSGQDVPRFSEEQTARIAELTKEYVRWFQSHPGWHNTLNTLVLLSLFAADLAGLIGGTLWIANHPTSAGGWVVAAAGMCMLHGFIMYSVIIFSVHEGAAHDRLILRTGPFSGALRFLAHNASRPFFADPIYYREQHTPHHGHFGTPEDGSFTNFVHPRRFMISLLPLAVLLDFNDFRTHRDVVPSRSRTISMIVGSAYTLPLIVFMFVMTGPWLPLIVLVLVGPWFGFTLDRVRESTEHNLMSLEARHGARNLGLGFWGLLVGGGPWGQPCHLSHHLAPALPWYLQCLLHVRLKAMMSDQQRRYYTLQPVIGYPRLVLHLVRTSLREARRPEVTTDPAA